MATKNPVHEITFSSFVTVFITLAPVTTCPSPKTSSVSVLNKISIFSVFLTLCAIILEALKSSFLTSMVTFLQSFDR